MISAQIIDIWLGNGRFRLNETYGERGSFVDASGQPAPVGTPCIIEALVSDAVYNDILNDPDYGDGAILWSEVVADE